MENNDRERDGLWIPIEIELVEDTSWLEKVLLARIYSMRRRGCFASNEYIAVWLGTSERWVSEVVSKLLDRGLLVNDGNHTRRNLHCTVLIKNEGRTPVPPKVEPQFVEGRTAVPHSIGISNRDSASSSESVASPSLPIFDEEQYEDEPERVLEACDEEGNPLTPNGFGKRAAPKEPSAIKDYNRILDAVATLRGGKPFYQRPKQYKALAQFKTAGLSPSEIFNVAQEMCRDPFYADKGWDMSTVFSYWDKKSA